MRMIPRDNWFELAVFLMDYHSGQDSRGYRLLCKLNPVGFNHWFCTVMRETEIYQYLIDTYSDKV
jgi:hypothetical protein